MGGRTWKKVEASIAERIRSQLLKNGGLLDKIKSDTEVWRIKHSDSTFTYYKSGTIYSTPSNSEDPAVVDAWGVIDSFAGPTYVFPTKEFLIGLDETGKGELVGHTMLTGVIFPKNLFDQVDHLAGPADTKKSHGFAYWDDVFRKLDLLRGSGDMT